jgi:hypothetical protein
MIHVAHELGWLSRDQRRDELVQMVNEMMGRKTIAGTDVDLACAVNKGVNSTARWTSWPRRQAIPTMSGIPPFLPAWATAMRMRAHSKGLVSPSDADVRIAQSYLRQRPIADADELRAVTRAIAGMNGVRRRRAHWTCWPGTTCPTVKAWTR